MSGSHGYDGAVAIPFITVDDEGVFSLNQEAVDYLQSITGKISVVAIAGTYRTGKSYLLNQLSGKSGNFGVGNTVKACTKGIWMWGQGIEKDGVTTIFLDTEGLGSTIRSETYDCRIFALALLLSSTFLLNSFGTLDSNAISKLSFVVQLTRHIHVRARGNKDEDSGTEFASFFPSLIWVLRDFAVKLERDGRKISAREYLEHALKDEDGLSEEAEARNVTRRLLRTFFPERDCVCMFRPVADEKALANLPNVPYEDLRVEFRTSLELLKRKVDDATTRRSKALYGKALNGSMFVSLAGAYVEALNSGATPTIASAWDRVVAQETEAALRKSLDTYSSTFQSLRKQRVAKYIESLFGKSASNEIKDLDEELRRGELFNFSMDDLREELKQRLEESEKKTGVVPVSVNDILEIHMEATSKAVETFNTQVVGDADKDPEIMKKFYADMASRCYSFRSNNAILSKEYSELVLDTLYDIFEDEKKDFLESVKALVSAPPQRGGVDSGAGAQPTEEKEDVRLEKDRSSFQNATNALTARKEMQHWCNKSSEALYKCFSIFAISSDKDEHYQNFTSTRLPRLLKEVSEKSDEMVNFYTDSATTLIHTFGALLSASRGQAEAAEKRLESTQKSHEKALEQASKRAAEELDAVKSILADRNEELARLNQKFDRLVSTFEADRVRSSEDIQRLQNELSEMTRRLDETHTTKFDKLIELAIISQRLSDAEKDKGEAMETLAELRLRFAEEQKANAVMAERVRAAENETVRLRETSDVLFNNNDKLKDQVEEMENKVVDYELQLAEAKSRYAAVQSDMGAIEASLSQMETLAKLLKSAIVKDRNLVRKLGLDPLSQRVFDSLDVE